ncbi:MAG: bifunctional phosphopantothenoylcysteine decarboxylase/phosphopantothenate--cysteine ligase CoaBC [Christensenellales bacterium]|jgi:phosphopantothenoylcysteine decarboxylase/phosphopantothenate--cysteine ligase
MHGKKTVLLGVTGSIAAYKAVELASALVKKDLDVVVVMTEAATRFVTPLTFETITKNPVATGLFTRERPYEVEHISLAKRADVFVVAPASGNFIGKYAHGIADDMLTTVAMALTVPVLIAPAMNSAMYLSAANTANMKLLKERGCVFVEPIEGLLACGDVGVGKLADVDALVSAILATLYPKKDFAGKRVLVSAGPTREMIDPVRFLTNRSTGKMGYAIAEAARDRGAEVVLVSGPVSIPKPAGVKVIDVLSTQDMLNAVVQEFKSSDCAIKAAAPADFTPEEYADDKIKKTGADGMTLKLKKTPDILATLGEIKGDRVLCGFAAETRELGAYAVEKLRRKNLDLIVANDVSRADAGFGVDTNCVTVYLADGSSVDYSGTKRAVADHVLDEISKIMSARKGN